MQGQSYKDLSAKDKSLLFQGIIYSERGECHKANQFLNSFILRYKGDQLEYWSAKAREYLLPCSENITNNELEYVYRPNINTPTNSEDPTIHHEEAVGFDLEVFLDMNRFTIDHIVSLSPESFYPIIDDDSTNNSGVEESYDIDIDIFLDMNRFTIDDIVSLSPESFYPLIEDSDSNGEHDNSVAEEESHDIDIEVFLDMNRFTINDITSLHPESFYPLIDPTIITPPADEPELPSDIPPIKIWIAEEKENKQSQTETDIRIWSPSPSITTADNPTIKIWTPEQPNTKSMQNETDVRIWSSAQPLAIDDTPIKIWSGEPSTSEKKANTIDQGSDDETPTRDIVGDTNQKTNEKEQLANESATVKKSSNLSEHYKVLITVRNNPDQSYLSLMDIGPVYTEATADSRSYKYFVGQYQELKEADATLKKVKEKGFYAASIRKYEQGIEVATIKQQAVPNKESNIKESKVAEIAEAHPAIPELRGQSYHVLFKVISRNNRRFPRLASVGEIYIDYAKDIDRYRYLIGGAQNLSSAKALLKKVKEKGYKEAFIAEYIDGTFQNTQKK